MVFRSYGWVTTLLLCAACASGCGSRPKPDVTDPDPAAKIPGIKQTVDRKDLSKVHQLVSDLNSDDQAVRFYSIHALRDLTGQTFGYQYFADDEQRKPAIQKWNDWLKREEVANR